MRLPRALVVEDEALIAMMLQMFLEELGYTVEEMASNIQDAVRAASEGNFEVAFLDVNLNGEKTSAVPKALQERNIPFAFVTGYGAHEFLADYAEAPIVTKPFSKTAIVETLEALNPFAPVKDHYRTTS